MKIPKYRKQTGRNFAFVEYQGQRHRLPGEYNSKKSKQAYAEFLAEISQDKTPEVITDKVTLLQLCSSFLDWAEVNHTQKEYQHYSRLTEVLGGSNFIGLRVSSIGPNIYRQIQQFLVDYRPKQKKGLRKPPERWSRQYVNRQMDKLKDIFQWAVSIETVGPEHLLALDTVPPLKKNRTTAPEAKKVKPVDYSPVYRTIEFAGPVVGAMIELQLVTGMRPGNVCRICPAEIIDRHKKIWTFRPIAHKSEWRGIILSIPIGPQTQEIIKPFLDRPEEQPFFSPQESEAWRRLESGHKCTGNFGRVGTTYNTGSYNHAVKTAIQRANKSAEEQGKPELIIKPWSPGQLRHTVATEIRAKYGLEAAQVLLGHASADVTQIYAERNWKLAVQVAANL